VTDFDFENEPFKTAFAMYPEIEAMFQEFPNYPPVMLPSKYWRKLTKKNLQQLSDS